MLSKTKINRYFILLALTIGGFLLAKNVFALDVGTNEISNAIQLGTNDPRTIVARIINVAMMFLGIIAVGIVIFAGFKWMTSQGNEEQIESAKKILKAGVIGLVIILASWGIAAFILNRLLGATGNGGNGGNNPGGGGNLPPCSGNGCVGMACDDLPLMPGCNYSTSSCQVGLACAPATCTCQPCPPSNPNCATNPPGSFGDACDGDLTNNDVTPTCDADNTMCDTNQGLTCDINSCTCLGSPVITDISPVGGFCEGNNNLSCDVDADCTSGTGPCNTDAPNGATNNIISIHGYNFGTSSTSTVGLSKVTFLGNESNLGDDRDALNPTVVNPVCNDSWTNNEIIVAIPAGVAAGPLKVINGNLNSNLIDFDTTNNTTGPQIPGFISNTIVRPGICRITPDAGVLGDSVSYYGNNLSGSGYFGNEANKFKGISSTFNTANTSGQVLVPNVGTGYMSTFVVNPASQKSNYVAFRKNQEPPVPPSISGFEPETGNAGQYITVRGSGFGNSRGTSQLFFESTEADYNFPAACLHSVWADNQVIVKVPAGLTDGAYTLKMKIGAWDAINSSNTFTADSAASLLPSLCKIEPSRGPVNAQVSFYGEYFSSSTTGVARFYNIKDASGLITNDNGANKLKANVPMDAVTGPVKIIDNSRVGNSLNFMVGSCTNNTECDGGTPYCCPLGSPKQGQCTIALMDANNGCYTSVPTSVFEWKFGTSLAVPCGEVVGGVCSPNNTACTAGVTTCDATSCTCQPCGVNGCSDYCGDGAATCNPNNNICYTGETCDATTCQCVESYYSCAQKGGGDSCPTGFCPNSPGQCSPYPGGQSQNIGACKDDCSNILGCTGGNCNYDSNLNKCVDSNLSCHPSELYTYDSGAGIYASSDIVVERVCFGPTNSNIGRWRINTSSVCPTGWVNIGGNKCELQTEDCKKCSPGFSCNNDNRCVNNSVICSSGSVCQGTQCVKEDSASCDCCCEKGQDARDCCAPLTCAGTCGNVSYTDTNSITHDFGNCSGCSNVGGTNEEHDAACNCAGTSGKFCQDDGGTGICVDCTDLSEGDCTDHASTCCWDDKDDVCRGGDGELVTSNPDDVGKYGHCAFYTCASTTANQCSTNVNIYSTSTSVLSNYVFKNSNQCTGCTTFNPAAACATITDSNTCKTESGCCWDMGTYTPMCTSGNKIPVSSTNPAAVPGTCDYFDCQSTPNSEQCVATSSPLSVGAYATWNACSAGCKIPHLGASCSSFATTTNLTAQTCNVSMCGGVGFGCFTYNGGLVSSTTAATAGCGSCCCDPDNNTCSTINSVLQCVKDKGNCSGNDRGLCCGCQNDSQCGNVDTLGCSFDSCCNDRPGVLTNSPEIDEQNVCRNSVVSVTFDKKMDNTSLNNNLILLSESTSGNCPAGTSHLALGGNNNQNIFARIFNQVIGFFKQASNRIARLFNPNQAIAYSISSTATYCVTPGVTTYESTPTTTILKFNPSTVLQPNTNYIALVKGQDNKNNLASSTALGKAGVLSSSRVGMVGGGFNTFTNFPVNVFGPFGAGGPTFNNSYSWNFKTLSDNNATSGLCLVDSVDLSPPGYIFQKNTNDNLVENDISSSDNTFDTSADRDKLYIAKALSASGLELQPVASYGWTWNWTINDQTKIKLDTASDLAVNGNRRLLSVQTGIDDATVTVKAETVMANNAYATPSKSQEVLARVFVCLNPWPPVNNIYQWSPSRDLAGATYGNYSYEFYYCRDAGDPATTADDLPAISSGGDIINLGLSTRKVCSNSRSTECVNDVDCPSGGFCIPDILKESYFFQQ